MKIWNSFINLGTSENHFDENEMIKLYNAMALISSLGCLIMLLCALYSEIYQVYVIITIILFSFYLLVILFNAIGQYKISRLIVCLGSPIWICSASIAIGGFFAQGAAILAVLAITFITYRNQYALRNRFILFQIVSFILCLLYLSIKGPIFKSIAVPYDEIVVFLGSIGWAIILVYKYDKDKTNLLKNLKLKVKELNNTTSELEQFTYIASHDLKSPLSTIISFTELIERDIEQNNYEGIQKKLEFVKSGATQMNYLVEDILELSLLKEQTKSIRKNIDLNEVLVKAKLNLAEEIKSNNVLIRSTTLPHFKGNELELLLLFQNIIQNGIKYNHNPSPQIDIKSNETPDNLKISFQDNGIGIKKEYHDYIFQFFKRLHTREEYKGTGLGLGLCKKIVNAYNGSIEVHSEINKGSSFVIKLPIEK